jgi:predicted nucleic acid-binding protein
LSGIWAIVGRLGYRDALLLAAASAAGVEVMISEDMADGLEFRGLRVVNPFGPDGPSQRVRELLGIGP